LPSAKLRGLLGIAHILALVLAFDLLLLFLLSHDLTEVVADSSPAVRIGGVAHHRHAKADKVHVAEVGEALIDATE
jgi:uncharacterized protein (DUF58 family)